MSEILVTTTRVKEQVKAQNKSMSGDFPEALSGKVQQLINDAVKRASENGRNTVMAKDL